jgi:hypothetical protein
MTLYRKRLTSSFYAIRQSLQRRLEGISAHGVTILLEQPLFKLRREHFMIKK